MGKTSTELTEELDKTVVGAVIRTVPTTVFPFSGAKIAVRFCTVWTIPENMAEYRAFQLFSFGKEGVLCMEVFYSFCAHYINKVHKKPETIYSLLPARSKESDAGWAGIYMPTYYHQAQSRPVLLQLQVHHAVCRSFLFYYDLTSFPLCTCRCSLRQSCRRPSRE